MGVEFVIDEDSMSVEKIREFRQDPDVFSPIMGNLQNLDNGNTLVSWGGNTFTEYDAEHQIVHEGIFTNCDIPTYGVNKYRWQNKSFVTDLEKVEFASAGFGDTLTEVVHIQNHLSEELVINEFKLGQSSFYVNPDTITIQSGGQARLEIHFSPERNGNIYDTLTIRSNRADRSIATQLILSGTGSGITTSSGQMGIAPLNYYPVPFQEFIRYSSHKAMERSEITDMTGRMVLSVSDLEMHGYIDTGKLEAGSYFVTTHYFDKTKNQSIIIKSSN
jgi:hypothetical protein